jgi:hypothetical protein
VVTVTPSVEFPAPFILRSTCLWAPNCSADLRPAVGLLGERLGPKPVDAQPEIALVVLLLDEAALAQDAKVAAQSRRAHLEGGRELARRPGPAAQQVHDTAPRGVRERRECPVNSGRHHSGASLTCVAKIQRCPSGSTAR